MKTTLIVLIFLASITPTTSQVPLPHLGVLEASELKTWFSLRGGIDPWLSCISKFRNDTSRSATILRRCYNVRCETQTWLNQYQGDTSDQFNWGSAVSPRGLISLRINNDEFDDFLNLDGKLFLGTKQGLPDTGKVLVLPQHIHMRAGSTKNTYGDINSDGLSDIFYYQGANRLSPTLMSIICGGSDVANLKTTRIRSIIVGDSTISEVAVVLYKNKEEQWRLITYTSARFKVDGPPVHYYGIPEKAGIHLYKVVFTVEGDSTKAELSLLDTFRSVEWDENANVYYQNNWSPVALGGNSTLFKSPHLPSIYLYPSIFKVTGSLGNYSLKSINPILEITHDRFELLSLDRGCDDCLLLDHSIDGDSVEDMARGYIDAVFFYSISTLDFIPQLSASFNLEIPNGSSISDLYSIKDVNNDGINDVAMMFEKGPNTYVIALGAPRNLLGVSEQDSIALSIGSPYPQPASKSTLLVPLSIDRGGLYELKLFDMQGHFIKSILSARFESGRIDVPMETLDIASGSYSLQLCDRARNRSRVIVISK